MTLGNDWFLQISLPRKSIKWTKDSNDKISWWSVINVFIVQLSTEIIFYFIQELEERRLMSVGVELATLDSKGN